MTDIAQKLQQTIRDIPDFPKPGIVFKDITPVLSNPQVSKEVSEAFHAYWKNSNVDVIVGIESRGFMYGLPLAQDLSIPFVPVRKVGKLPYTTIKHSYDLEYGSAEVEIHTDAITPGQRVLIHDDLLATGGTAVAAAELIRKIGGEVVGYSFLVELSFLKGREKLGDCEIQSLISY